MHDQVAQLAFITVVAVLEQAYFSMQVIWARRKYKISPPNTSGHPTFERVFRAQLNCSEYFPVFLSVLWVAGIFFHQGIAAICGFFYLCARYEYFSGYTASAQGRELSNNIFVLYHEYADRGLKNEKLLPVFTVIILSWPMFRLRPMYISATFIWILTGLSLLGLIEFFLKTNFGVSIKENLVWLTS